MKLTPARPEPQCGCPLSDIEVALVTSASDRYSSIPVTRLVALHRYLDWRSQSGHIRRFERRRQTRDAAPYSADRLV